MPETEPPGLPPRPGAVSPRPRESVNPDVAVPGSGPSPAAFGVGLLPRPRVGGEGVAAPEAYPGDEASPPQTAALFEAAVRGHSRRLLAIARAIVHGGNRGGVSAEDVVQQALTNLYQHRGRYDWREPGGLMRRAVVNEALRVLRQPRTTAVADDHPDLGRTVAGAPPGASSFALRGYSAARPWSPADPMIDQETVLRVRQAIGRLPEHFRAALVLCEYEGMAYNQIAEVLGASVPQVKTWLHRGRRQLAEMLKDFVGAEPKQPRHRQKATGPSPSSNGDTTSRGAGGKA